MKRRQFLQGLGGSIFALPFLESLLSQSEARAADGPGTFAIFMHQGNGTIPERWWPSTVGKLTAASMAGKAVEPLTPFIDHLLFVKGVHNPYKNFFGNCDHSSAGAQVLTGAQPEGPPDGNPNKIRGGGMSIDFLIASTLGKKDPLNLIACKNSGINAVMSYRGSKDAIAAEQNPMKAYRALFSATTTVIPDSRALLRTSANDLVRSQMKALLANPKLSKDDKARLELHMSNIRDMETNMATNLTMPEDRKTAIGGTVSYSDNDYSNRVPDIAKMHMDIIALATATGQSRASNIQVGNGMDYTNYNSSGVSMPSYYHDMSHRTDKDSKEVLHQVDKMMQGLFAYLLTQLDRYKFQNGAKSLLDYGCATYLNSLEYGAAHTHSNIPHVVAGSCNGVLAQGVYIDAPNSAKNKFLSSIGKAVGLTNATDFNAKTADQRGLIDKMFV